MRATVQLVPDEVLAAWHRDGRRGTPALTTAYVDARIRGVTPETAGWMAALAVPQEQDLAREDRR